MLWFFSCASTLSDIVRMLIDFMGSITRLSSLKRWRNAENLHYFFANLIICTVPCLLCIISILEFELKCGLNCTITHCLLNNWQKSTLLLHTPNNWNEMQFALYCCSCKPSLFKSLVWDVCVFWTVSQRFVVNLAKPTLLSHEPNNVGEGNFTVFVITFKY